MTFEELRPAILETARRFPLLKMTSTQTTLTMSVKGNDVSTFALLNALPGVAPIVHFEVTSASLEDVFLELLDKRRAVRPDGEVRTMKMILAVMYREYRIRTTSLTWLFYDLFMPLTYLLLFGIGLNSAFSGGMNVQGATVDYNAFFLAGVLSMACFGIAINTSYGFFVDRDNGIFYEFLTYPMTRAEFLIGKILFNCLLSLIQGIITIVAAVVLLRRRGTLGTARPRGGRTRPGDGGMVLLPHDVCHPDPAERHVQHVHQRRLLRADVRKHHVLSGGHSARLASRGVHGQSADLAHRCAPVCKHRNGRWKDGPAGGGGIHRVSPRVFWVAVRTIRKPIRS